MQVARTGLTSVKGGRHRALASVRLTADGAVGDREFCLVDPACDRCVRTVEEPTLLQTSAAWDGRLLTVDLPSGRVAGEPVDDGTRTVDYWGRSTAVDVVAGPWAAAYSAHLGREVLLVGAPPGAVVYGGAVTLVSRASLDRLADVVGHEVEAARFRSTVVLDGDLQPLEEDGWVGRRLRLGGAEVRVTGVVPRCAVIDHDPDTAERDLPLLKALPRLRPEGGMGFGVEAEVVAPGEVATRDPAVLLGSG